MSAVIPSDPKKQLLFIWKILDVQKMGFDRIAKFIAFDMELKNLPEARDYLKLCITNGWLIENKDTEEVQLAPELMKEFQSWQHDGNQKAQKMASLLRKSWREPFQITEDIKYNVYTRDFIDETVWNKAAAGRPASAVKIQNDSLIDPLQGSVRDTKSDGTSIEHDFLIQIRDRVIKHQCPDYLNVRKPQKKFCLHLTQVLMKSYIKDKGFTLRIIEDLVKNRNLWRFE